MVKDLTEIAEREGLARALSDEAEYGVIRGIFPTREEYVTHEMDEFQAINDYFAQARAIAKKHGGIEGFLGAAMVAGILSFTASQRNERAVRMNTTSPFLIPERDVPLIYVPFSSNFFAVSAGTSILG